MSLASFNEYALTRAEMKGTLGGALCMECKCDDGSGYTGFDPSQKSKAYKAMRRLCGGDGYSCWSVNC